MSSTHHAAGAQPAAAPVTPPPPLFHPSARQMMVLGVIVAAAIGCGMYLRHRVLADAGVAAACAAGGGDWLCTIRDATIAAIGPSAFGFAALLSALLNLWRPSLALCGLALIAGGLGIVLFNAGLSALAVAVLTLSLARPGGAAA